jgi:hypothetical protein
VAEDAGARVNADLLAVPGILDGLQPLIGFDFIQLDTEAVGGGEDLAEFFFGVRLFHFQFSYQNSNLRNC